MLRRNVFLSNKGYIGVCHDTAQPGDIICVLLGGNVPLILRPEGNNFKLISDCYVHGLMDGEALAGVDIETHEFEIFTLV